MNQRLRNAASSNWLPPTVAGVIVVVVSGFVFIYSGANGNSQHSQTQQLVRNNMAQLQKLQDRIEEVSSSPSPFSLKTRKELDTMHATIERLKQRVDALEKRKTP